MPPSYVLDIKEGDCLRIGASFYLNDHLSVQAGWPFPVLRVGREQSHLDVPKTILRFLGINSACLTFPTRCLSGPWKSELVSYPARLMFLGLYIELPNEVVTGVKLLLPRWSPHWQKGAGNK